MGKEKLIIDNSLFINKIKIPANEIGKVLTFYHKVADIVERTHVAMGRKRYYKIAISSTKDQKLNTNVCVPTTTL